MVVGVRDRYVQLGCSPAVPTTWSNIVVDCGEKCLHYHYNIVRHWAPLRARPTPHHQRPMLVSDRVNGTTGWLVCLELQSHNLVTVLLLPRNISRQHLARNFSLRVSPIHLMGRAITSNITHPKEYMSPDTLGLHPESRSGAAHLTAPALLVLDNRSK